MAFIKSDISSAFASPLADSFLSLLLDLVPGLDSYRVSPKCSDELWFSLGVWRCLSEQPSGRAFLQTNANLSDSPGVVPYFDSLRSERRFAVVAEGARALVARLSACSAVVDVFAGHKELLEFDLYAGDGHYLKAAVHDPRKLGAKDFKPKAEKEKNKTMDRVRVEPEGTQYATGHFFALNLRNNLMSHLALGDEVERKKEHDMRALKALSKRELRLGAATGRNSNERSC